MLGLRPSLLHETKMSWETMEPEILGLVSGSGAIGKRGHTRDVLAGVREA